MVSIFVCSNSDEILYIRLRSATSDNNIIASHVSSTCVHVLIGLPLLCSFIFLPLDSPKKPFQASIRVSHMDFLDNVEKVNSK